MSLQGVSRKTAIEVAEKESKAAKSARSKLAKLKENAAEVGQRVMGTALTIGAGAAVGFLDAKYPGKWLNVDKEIWIGGALLALGLLRIGGDTMSDAMLYAGNGVMAAWAYNAVKTRV